MTETQRYQYKIEYDQLKAKYEKAIHFIKSISNHINFSETQDDFNDFYTGKENEAYKLLKELNQQEPSDGTV